MYMRALKRPFFAAAAAVLLAGSGAYAHEGEGEGEHLIPHMLNGLHLDGGMTWYLQGTDGAVGGDSADLTYTLDLNLQSHVGDSGNVFVVLEAGNGQGVDARLGSLSTANYDAFITEVSEGFNAPSISQLYYEGEYYGGFLTVDFGKLDVHSMYDDNAYANDETDQFMSGIFTRSAGTSYGELDQYYAPGLALTFGLSDTVSLMALVANGNGAGFDEVSDRPYAASQLTVSPSLGDLEGNYRVYGIYDARQFQDAAGNNQENVAWGVSVDQALPGGLGFFGRYSAQDDSIETMLLAGGTSDPANLVESAWSAGIMADGNTWGRAGDVFGIGYGSVNVNAGNSQWGTTMSIPNPDDEAHLEAYYKIHISDHFTVTPDVQIIENNGGDPTVDTVTVYGVRGQINF